MLALDVDEVIAHLLVAEGFTSIEEIVETPLDELNRIEGFEEDVSRELQNRAASWLEEQRRIIEKKLKDLGIADDLVELGDLTSDHLVKLGEAGIKTRDDFADLATDELIEILGRESIGMQTAENLIMKARAHWFPEELAATTAEEAA